MMERSVKKESAQWAADFRARAARNRTPVSATLELTARCNLRCQHCYLGSQDELHSSPVERNTRAVLDSLDEWAGAGCLYLLITGGEPMLREDFCVVYRHAVELGMLVTVFCNGTWVTEDVLALFHEYPPRGVEISVYGATAETHEAVTQVPGSFSRAWKGIHQLHQKKIHLTLKTMVLTLNEHEVEAMAAQAEALGCTFRFDASVFPCLSGGTADPLSLRVAPEVIVKHDVATRERWEKWAKNIETYRVQPEWDRLYTCGAGVTMFYSDPYGNLSPCLMSTTVRVSPNGRSFRDVWREELGVLQNRKRTQSKGGCVEAMRGACTSCPAQNYLETGDEETESDYMKKTTQLRYETVMKKRKAEKAL